MRKKYQYWGLNCQLSGINMIYPIEAAFWNYQNKSYVYFVGSELREIFQHIMNQEYGYNPYRIVLSKMPI